MNKANTVRQGFIGWIHCVGMVLGGISSASASQSVQGWLQAHRNVTLSYEQTTRDHQREVLDQATGTLQLMAPSHFRITTQGDQNSTWVSDGHNLYQYESDLNQVTVTAMKNLPAPPLLMAFYQQPDVLHRAFRIHETKQNETQTLTLTPKTPTMGFDNATLTLAQGQLESLLVCGPETETLYRFHHQQFGINRPADFHFTMPPGAEVVTNG